MIVDFTAPVELEDGTPMEPCGRYQFRPINRKLWGIKGPLKSGERGYWGNFTENGFCYNSDGTFSGDLNGDCWKIRNAHRPEDVLPDRDWS